MQQSYRLRKNKQYQYVYHRGRSCACREIVLLYARSSKLQVGFSVSRKVGNSVVRNRVKRRMREQFRALIPQLKPGILRRRCQRKRGKSGFARVGWQRFYPLPAGKNSCWEKTPANSHESAVIEADRLVSALPQPPARPVLPLRPHLLGIR